MSTGLVIDAFLVRTLLVPSLIALVGPRSAWPSQLRLPAPESAPAPVVAAAESTGKRGPTRPVTPEGRPAEGD